MICWFSCIWVVYIYQYWERSLVVAFVLDLEYKAKNGRQYPPSPPWCVPSSDEHGAGHGSRCGTSWHGLSVASVLSVCSGLTSAAGCALWSPSGGSTHQFVTDRLSVRKCDHVLKVCSCSPNVSCGPGLCGRFAPAGHVSSGLPPPGRQAGVNIFNRSLSWFYRHRFGSDLSFIISTEHCKRYTASSRFLIFSQLSLFKMTVSSQRLLVRHNRKHINERLPFSFYPLQS